MKKIYNSNWLFKLKTAAVLCSMLFAGTAMAQLSGTYSIDGGGTGDFTTFTQLADTLNSDGVSGPVIVNVAAGTYAQNFSILNVTGLSTTNSLTINGGGATISSSNDVITLRGVSGVNIDNLKIECNGTSSKNVWIYNGGTASPSSNISITNCELTKPNGSLYATASAYVKIGSGSSFSSNASQNNTDITIEDNLMHGGSTSSSAGVYTAISNNHPTSAAADQNVVIRNNDISGFRYYGVYSRYTSGVLIQGNEIHNPANIPQQYKYGIYIYNNDYSSEYAATEKNVIDKNWVHDLGSTTNYYYQYGLYFYNYYGNETTEVTNNVFHMNSQSSVFGIYYQGSYTSGATLNLIGNTIIDQGDKTYTYNYQRPVYIYYTDVTMKNNIVYCDADNAYYTYGVYIYYGPNNVAPVMTHNNMHLENMTNNGNTWRYAYINGNYDDADAWLNSTYGANSVSVDPNFVDLANSVCIPNSIEMANKAEVNALSTEDITYATRSTTPDMGAYEYLVDLEVVSVDMVGGSECAPWTEEVAITIRNNGAYPITNVPMKYTINGSGGATETITTSIGAGASSSFAFANVPTLVGSNTHVIDVTVDGVDDNPSNSAGQHTIITTASATGGDLTQGATYDGYFNNGNMNDPDVTVKDYVLEYDITRPTKYSASAPGADYGYTLAATTMGGVDVTALGFSLINSDETLMVDPDPSLADSTIYMSITVLDNNTLCDTTFGRYLYVPHFPTASFTPADICLGDVASFKNTSTLGGSDYMLNTWEFDDPDPAVTDDNSDIQDGFWSYTTYGSADVVLTVINGVYPLFEYTATHTITVTPKPELDFKVLNACEGTPIQFNNASGLPAGITGTIAYSWDFAGEGTSAAENPTFTFATPGQRVVTLSAVANGCAATLSKNAYQFEMPTASFVPPTSACNYEEVTFTNTSVIPNDANMGFAWDFNAEGISRLETPSYPFATPGSKTVTLTATSEFGCESMSSETFVLEESPEADFSWDAACNLTPINFTFTGSAPNGGAQSSFVWDYNGENTETNPTSPMHLFGDVGTKEVTLTVADVNGCSNSITKEIDVVLQATAAFDVSDVCEGDEAIFTNSSTVAAGDLEYTWEFGDAGQSTSTDLNPRFSYPITGNTRIVNVTLNAIVPGGCPDVLTKSLTINAAPDATFTADRQGRHVEFTGPSGMTIYQWRFGDGAKSTDQNPSYTYTNVDQGSFEVCLTTKNTICWSDDECQTVVIDLLGVEKLAQNNDMINVYPNPNAGSFNLEIANASDDVVIKVGDILGNEVPVELVDMFNGKYSVNMSAIADGVYFVQVKNGDFYATKRITVSNKF